MPTPIVSQFPLSITILCYTAVFIMIVITVLLFRINGRLATLSARLSKSSRASKLAEPDAEPQQVEVASGTAFEKFLEEDPKRRSLAKKEQFKEYRKWRDEKGLNWSSKD